MFLCVEVITRQRLLRCRCACFAALRRGESHVTAIFDLLGKSGPIRYVIDMGALPSVCRVSLLAAIADHPMQVRPCLSDTVLCKSRAGVVHCGGALAAALHAVAFRCFCLRVISVVHYP